MPYKIEKQGDQWCVVGADGKSTGCSDSEAKAKAHMAALYASENKAASQPTGAEDATVPFDLPGCIDSTAKKYELAGMNPALALSRAEQDCQENVPDDENEVGAEPTSTPTAGKQFTTPGLRPPYGTGVSWDGWVKSLSYEQKLDLIDKGYPITEKELGEKRNIPQSKRNEMPASEFAGEGTTFPINKAEDVTAAATRLNSTNQDKAKVKANIIRIAKKHGWVSSLPQTWQDELKAKSFNARLQRGLKALGILPETPVEDMQTSFKVSGNHWLAVWTNNFKDRDAEMFPEREIESYMRRVDMGIVPKPDLWVWHGGKEVRVGQAEQVAGHGHFGIAAGVFDDTETGNAARDYYAAHAPETSISHGFTFPQKEFDGTHYKQFNTFEISLLPRGVEANIYTSLEGVKAMKLDDRKKAYFEKVFGAEVFAKVLTSLDERGKALEELGVEFKDFSDIDLKSDEKSAALETALKELIPQAIEDSGTAVVTATEAVKQVKAMREENAALRKEFDAMRVLLNQRPRSASQADSTVIDPEKHKELTAALEEQGKAYDDFFHAEVKKPLNGKGG